MDKPKSRQSITLEISKDFFNPGIIGLFLTLFLFCLHLLVGRKEGGLDNQKIEAEIKQDLEKQARVSLKSVSCPENIPLMANLAFECQGEISPEQKFPVTVKQKDDQGNIEWEVRNSPSLLNLTELASQFQDEMRTKTGKNAVINCGDKYRVNKPGDTFDCMVSQGEAEKITVKIDSLGNINWQEVLPPTLTPPASVATISDAIPALVQPNNPNLPVIPPTTPETPDTAGKTAIEPAVNPKTAKQPATAVSAAEATPEVSPDASPEAASSSNEKGNDFLNDPAALDDLE
ncbi:MAG: DUF4333 domain-containing protein [Nostocaceae cyanobacterium]|nr:DUF4333 domain-containing protein [Nostocaceae cyanobacterium]